MTKELENASKWIKLLQADVLHYKTVVENSSNPTKIKDLESRIIDLER